MNNNRRSFLGKLSLLAGGLSFIAPTIGKAEEVGEPAKKLKGDIVHIVFLWLKEPIDQKTRDYVYEEMAGFVKEIKSIKSSHIGTPADTDRPVVDSSYTFSLIASFNSMEDLQNYQVHSAHKTFITNTQKHWEKVQIYDSSMMIG